jgi:hypothetical protein
VVMWASRMDEIRSQQAVESRNRATALRARAAQAKKPQEAEMSLLIAEQLEAEADGLAERILRQTERPLFKGGL